MKALIFPTCLQWTFVTVYHVCTNTYVFMCICGCPSRVLGLQLCTPQSALNLSFSSFVVPGIKCRGICMLSRCSKTKLHYIIWFLVLLLLFTAGSSIRVMLDSEWVGQLYLLGFSKERKKKHACVHTQSEGRGYVIAPAVRLGRERQRCRKRENSSLAFSSTQCLNGLDNIYLLCTGQSLYLVYWPKS